MLARSTMFLSMSKFPLLALCLVAMLDARGADFVPCVDAGSAPALAGSLCAHEVVPGSYDDATASESATVTLFVRKFPAARRARGSVWLIAGGPGESGASFYPLLDSLRRGFPDFDLIIPDHRGTGYSTRLCPAEEAAESAGGAALAGAEWGSCYQHLNSNPAHARQFSLTNGAHDLKLLVERHRSDAPVYVYAVSYGTQLVLRTLQLGRLEVAGVVLDSLVPLQTAPEWELSRRSFVVDDIGRKVLAQCDADRACRRSLGVPAQAMYRRLLASAAVDPAILAEVPGKNLKQFLGNLLDVPAARQRIPYLIKDLEQGRNVELKAALAQFQRAVGGYGGYPQSPSSIPLVSIISTSENNLRPAITAEELRQEDEALLFTSPLAGFLVKPSLPVYARDQYFGRLPGRMPPMLVLHGTLDPKTHYTGAVSHVAALRRAGKVKLVTVAGASHFVLWTAPQCFERAARAFIAGQRHGDQTCGRPAAPALP